MANIQLILSSRNLVVKFYGVYRVNEKAKEQCNISKKKRGVGYPAPLQKKKLRVDYLLENYLMAPKLVTP